MLIPYTDGELDVIEAYLADADGPPVDDACARDMAGRLAARLRAAAPPVAVTTSSRRSVRRRTWPALPAWWLASTSAAVAAASVVVTCMLPGSGFGRPERPRDDVRPKAAVSDGGKRAPALLVTSTHTPRPVGGDPAVGPVRRTVAAVAPPPPAAGRSSVAATPVALAAPTSPAAEKPGEYLVQEGDTLSHIAERRYGTSRVWRRILKANPGLEPERLRPGRKIMLPTVSISTSDAAGEPS